jgi:hypothetical protein
MAELAHDYEMNKQAVKDKMLDPQTARENIRKKTAESAKTDSERASDAYKQQSQTIDDNKNLSAAEKAKLHSSLAKQYVKHGAGAGVIENPLYGILGEDPEFMKNYLNSGGKITTGPDGTVTMEGGNGEYPVPTENIGKGGVKLECSDYANEADVLKYLVSSQHPNLRQYFILDDEGYIIKTKASEGKRMLDADTTTYSADDKEVFNDLYTLVTASIPYKIAIDNNGGKMMPLQDTDPDGKIIGAYRDISIKNVLVLPAVNSDKNRTFAFYHIPP